MPLLGASTLSSCLNPRNHLLPGRNHLFVPGPTNVPERVLRVMNRQSGARRRARSLQSRAMSAHVIRLSENHRDPFFAGLTARVLADLKYLFKTDAAECFVFPSTGTGAWEAGLTNTLSPGDRVLCFRYGQFSHLWVDQARRLGLDVTVVEEQWGSGANEARLQQLLTEDVGKTYKAVMVVHNETTTGVTSDIAGVRRAMDAAAHPALLLVDGVSSIGACDFRMDEWRVDVAMTGSQKALSLPTGLAICCVSAKAAACGPSARLPRVFFSFDDMRKANSLGTFPYTPSIPLLYGLLEALAMLREEGLDNAIARHARLAAGTRAAVDAWGLKLLCSHPRWHSNSLSVIQGPPGMDTSALVRNAYAKYNLSIGLGLSEVAGKVFRIGHLGDLNEVSLLGCLAGVEMSLRDCGYSSFAPGAGVGAALSYFQKTSTVIPSRSL